MTQYLTFKRSELTDDIELDEFMWIPGEILGVTYLNQHDTTIIIESTILQYVLPPLSDHEQRTERMLTVVDSLNDKQRTAFLSILTRQKAAIQIVGLFIDHAMVSSGNGTEDRKKESARILKKIAIHMSGIILIF